MFLGEAPKSPHSEAAFQEDIEADGFVWALTRLWAWNPGADEMFGDLMGKLAEDAGLSFRDRGIIVTAAASTMENSGCALAWGNRLSTAADVETAVGVVNGIETDSMTARDRVLSRWARAVAGHPASTTQEDVQELRAIGFDDRAVFSLTLYIGLRLAFSTVNDALDAPLDRQLVDKMPADVVAAVDFGRRPA